jgi:hypothetical protein
MLLYFPRIYRERATRFGDQKARQITSPYSISRLLIVAHRCSSLLIVAHRCSSLHFVVESAVTFFFGEARKSD